MKYLFQNRQDTVTRNWDHIQNHFECCGLSNLEGPAWNAWTKVESLKRKVPVSCCRDEYDCNTDQSKINLKDCHQEIFKSADDPALAMMVMAILEAVLACCLIGEGLWFYFGFDTDQLQT